MTVNKERVQILVDALKSGNYAQVNGTLGSVAPNGQRSYCCLGVACEVAIKHGVSDVSRADAVPRIDYGRPYNIAYNGSRSTLPQEVQRWFGFSSDNPVILKHNDQPQTATYANDVMHLNFNQIGDLFERRYLSEDDVQFDEIPIIYDDDEVQ